MSVSVRSAAALMTWRQPFARALCSVDTSPVMGKGFPVETIPADQFDTVLIFATGSGVSPIRAVIESGALEAGKRRDVRLYYGARSMRHLAFQDRFELWREQGVSVVPVLSQGEPGWAGKRGYVQDAFALEDGSLADPSRTAVLLCGQKAMAEAVKERLGAKGVTQFLTNF